jgi:hypothetical protein
LRGHCDSAQLRQKSKNEKIEIVEMKKSKKQKLPENLSLEKRIAEAKTPNLFNPRTDEV